MNKMGDLNEHIYFTNYFAEKAQVEMGIENPKPVYDKKAIESMTNHFYEGHNKLKQNKK